MLSERTINIFEENDINLYDRSEQDGEFYREIEFYSDAGEDVIETVWYDGTDEGFINSFRTMANDFDEDEHAEMWIENRHVNGVPNSIRELIDDAREIKNTLIDIAEQLDNKKTDVDIILSLEEKLEKIKLIINERNGVADSQEFGLSYSQAVNYLDEIENIITK